jgi:Uma2 family endonuclease
MPLAMRHARLPQELFAEQIMVMPATQKRWWTEKDVRQLIEEASGPTPRYELVDGELLVTPGPNLDHQRIGGALYTRLRQYVNERRVGEALYNPTDIRLAPELLLQPDMAVLPFINGRRLPRDTFPSRLFLAIEMVSPSSARFDRMRKRFAYLAAGVPEYWVVDGDTRVIERWRLGDTRPELLDRELVWQPTEPDGVEPLRLDVSGLFDEALGED